jgi:hypothetical protein
MFFNQIGNFGGFATCVAKIVNECCMKNSGMDGA